MINFKKWGKYFPFLIFIKNLFKNRYIYYIDGNKFTTNEYFNIPFEIISSPDENTPAFEDIYYWEKIWTKKGIIWHRLTGPAFIDSNGTKNYYLNGKPYFNIQNWLKDHPNPDLYFDTINLPETERVLYFLKN
jgi:hypothetical protein